MRISLCLTFLFIIARSQAQDSAWREAVISPDLAIDMPGIHEKSDIPNVHSVSAISYAYSLQVEAIQGPFVIKSGEQWVNAYEAFIAGYFNTSEFSGTTKTVSDTTIQGIAGQWTHSRTAASGVFKSVEEYRYFVLINTVFYVITFTAHPSMDSARASAMQKYFTSIRFLHPPIKENAARIQEEAKTYRLSQKWAHRLPFLILGLLAIVMVALYIRYARKRSTQINDPAARQ